MAGEKKRPSTAPNPNTNNKGTWTKSAPSKSTATSWASAARRAVGR